MMDLSSKRLEVTALITTLLVVAISYALICYFAVNVPIWDDFDIHLSFLLQAEQTKGLFNIVRLLFEPNGEHFVVLNRLASWLCWQLLGVVNFRLLIVVGVFALPLSAFLFLRLAFKEKLSYWTIVPALFLLCAPQYDQSLIWASGVWQHLWVVPLCLAFFLLARSSSSRGLLSAALLATVATLTQANGPLAPLSAGLLLLLARKFRLGLLWLTLALILLVPVLHNSSHSTSSNPGTSLEEMITYLWTFLGSGLGYSMRSATLIGGLLCGLHAILQLFANKEKASVFLMIALWCVLTAAANTMARSGFGATYAWEQSRYHLPALLYAAALYCAAISQINVLRLRKLVIASLLFLSVIIFIGSVYRAYPVLSYRHDLAFDAGVRWQIAQQDPEYPNKAHGTQILLQAEKSKIYQSPNLDILSLISHPIERASQIVDEMPSYPVIRKVDHLLITPQYLLISGYAFIKGHKQASAINIKISGERGVRMFSTIVRKRPDVVQHYHRSHLLNSGFFALINRSAVDQSDSLQLVLKEDLFIAQSRALPLARHITTEVE